MSETKKTRLNVLNASGYLYQLRIEDELKSLKTYTDGNIEIIASEHRWVDLETKDEGFIDTIIENGIVRYVIETKRVQDGEWIFLLPEDSQNTPESRLLWTQCKSNKQKYADWARVIMKPSTYKSSFCLIRGQGEAKISFLERIGGVLIRSIESLSVEELEISSGLDYDKSYVYLPIIITNASLFTCAFDTERVDLSTGKLDDCSFQEVPFIQFYKNLSASLNTDTSPRNIKESNIQNNRSVFVVNSAHLADFFDKIQFPKYASQPWNNF